MGAFYGIRIKEGRENPDTGKPWSINDVHVYWRDDVVAWLAISAGGNK